MEDLVNFSGLDEYDIQSGEFEAVIIPVEKLADYGTSCGTVGNKPFTKQVIEYLKRKHISQAAIVADKEDKRILCMALPISMGSAYKFSRMVEQNEGSLRPDVSNISGWINFESE